VRACVTFPRCVSNRDGTPLEDIKIRKGKDTHMWTYELINDGSTVEFKTPGNPGLVMVSPET
jgi:hypothetical protein